MLVQSNLTLKHLHQNLNVTYLNCKSVHESSKHTRFILASCQHPVTPAVLSLHYPIVLHTGGRVVRETSQQ
jgi:hypothetical protein